MLFDLKEYELLIDEQVRENGVSVKKTRREKILASVHEDKKSDDIKRIENMGYRNEKSILIYTDFDLEVETMRVVYKNENYRIVSAPNNQRGLLYRTQAVAVTDVS